LGIDAIKRSKGVASWGKHPRFGYTYLFRINPFAPFERVIMPIYEYRCSACGHEMEVLQKLSDPLLSGCPQCGKPTLKKLLSAAGFQLKGSGWYATDFKGSGSKPAAKSTGDKDGESKPATKSTGDKDGGSKPAESKTESKTESKSSATETSSTPAAGSGGNATCH